MDNSKTVAVVGSRGFSDYRFLCEQLSVIPIAKIVSGGARGADSLAEKYALDNGIDVEVLKPDWARYGKAAGMIRNKLIVEQSEVVVAFWDGQSRGTKDSIDYAQKTGKKVILIRYNDVSEK